MEKVGVFRTGEEIKKAIAEIRTLREEFRDVQVSDTGKGFNSELLEVLELSNLLDLAYLTASAALNRNESRGAHSRDDFPERNDQSWLKHTIQTWTEVGPRIVYENVDATKYKPEERKY